MLGLLHDDADFGLSLFVRCKAGGHFFRFRLGLGLGLRLGLGLGLRLSCRLCSIASSDGCWVIVVTASGRNECEYTQQRNQKSKLIHRAEPPLLGAIP